MNTLYIFSKQCKPNQNYRSHTKASISQESGSKSRNEVEKIIVVDAQPLSFTLGKAITVDFTLKKIFNAAKQGFVVAQRERERELVYEKALDSFRHWKRNYRGRQAPPIRPFRDLKRGCLKNNVCKSVLDEGFLKQPVQNRKM